MEFEASISETLCAQQDCFAMTLLSLRGPNNIAMAFQVYFGYLFFSETDVHGNQLTHCQTSGPTIGALHRACFLRAIPFFTQT